MALFRVDQFRAFLDRYNERDRSLIQFAVANIIHDIASLKFRIELIELEADKIAILMESTDGQDLTSLMKEIQASVNDYLKLSISIAVSKSLNHDESLYEAYSDTLALSMYRLTEGRGN